MTNNHQSSNKTQKILEISSYSSQSPQSEEDNYACVAIQPKKQQKNDQCSPNIQNTQTNAQRQRRSNEDKKRNQKNKKRNKKNTNDSEHMIKKQSKKVYAAPPQLVTQSSKQNSSSSRSKSSSFQAQVAAPEQPKQSRRLYIGNLPSQVNQSQLRKLFKKYGSLKEVKLAINTTTGKSKGFAFVEYIDLHSSMKAKEELCLHIIGGMKMVVQFCTQEL